MSDRPIDDMAMDFLDKAEDSLEEEERRVLARIRAQKPISRHAVDVAEQRATAGDRLADRVAQVGGSWAFIIGFAVVLFGWMTLNSGVLERWGMTFDPYPFIFLNLMLSTLAAIQAPVIMMSQNRQAAKDRVAAELDFEVNLRAELEIIRLHAKVDNALAVKLDAILAQQALILRKLEPAN